MGSIVATFAILAVLTRPKIALTLEHDASDVVTGLESFEDIHVDNSLDWNTEANDECSNLVTNTIRQHGYPVEVHSVTTADGYILEMQRIPSSPNSTTPANVPKRPVLIIHGLLDSAGSFVLMGPNEALGYMMADSGYDVWLGNVRGNRYSRRHATMNPDGTRSQRRRFWNFSWHEIGMIDLPTMIDYVLSVNTNFTKIHYIGHSQGTTTFFVMASLRPDYNAKILLMNALAPVAYMENVTEPLTRTLSSFQKLIQAALSRLGFYEFRTNSAALSSTNKALCAEHAGSAELCQSIVFLILEYNPDLIDKTKGLLIMEHIPAGASMRQLFHYGQLYKRGTGFRTYHYGLIGNMQLYGSPTPPQYPLSQITAPVAMHYGLKDSLAAVVDVKRLAAQIPNLVELREIPHPDFGHIDFLYAREVRALVYNLVLDLMKDADQNQ